MALNANALCTVADVRNYYGIDEDTDIELLVEDLINRVSKQFESYCDKSFVKEYHTEYLDGGTGGELFPKHYPITTISGIWTDTGWTWGTDTEVDSTTYRVAHNNIVVLRSGTFTAGTQAIKIVYEAGYHQGDIETYDDVPLDLRVSAVKEVTRLYRDRTKKGISSADTDSGPGTYSYDYVMAEFEPETMGVLNRYKRKTAF